MGYRSLNRRERPTPTERDERGGRSIFVLPFEGVEPDIA